MFSMFKHWIDQVKSIQLNNFDKIAIMIYVAVALVYIISGAITVLTLGGLILMGGAFFTYKGKIFVAVAWYLIADFCWVWNAISISDYQGAIFVTIGVIFGVLASAKMKNGHMESELKHKVKDENSNN